MNRTIIVDGIPLTYLEKNHNRSKTIFFLHGNSNSHKIWCRQYQGNTLNEFRLIFLDLPGHGDSGDIPSKRYDLFIVAQTIALAIKKLLKSDWFAVVGLSLGGNIAVETLGQGLTPNALVILSSGLVGQVVKPENILQDQLVIDVLFTPDPEPDKVQKYFQAAGYQPDAELTSLLLDDFLKTDSEFRPSFAKSVANGLYSDEVVLINNWAKKVLVIYGRYDWIVKPTVLDNVTLPLWNENIVVLDNAGHFTNWDNSAAFNALILTYFQDQF